MKEHPIIFGTWAIPKLQDGSKTQTRRVIKIPDGGRIKNFPHYDSRGVQICYDQSGCADFKWLKCPYGQVGDRLWVRETFKAYNSMGGVAYKADGDLSTGFPWKPSIHMPRWASRIDLEITEVRAERLQEITEEDAKLEGCDGGEWCGYNAKYIFEVLWDSINGKKYPWDSNPWVWVISFKVV